MAGINCFICDKKLETGIAYLFECKKKSVILGGSGFFGKYFGLILPTDSILKTYYRNSIPCGVHFDNVSDSFHKIILNKKQYSHILLMSGRFRFDEIKKNEDLPYKLNLDCFKRLVDEIVDV